MNCLVSYYSRARLRRRKTTAFVSASRRCLLDKESWVLFILYCIHVAQGPNHARINMYECSCTSRTKKKKRFKPMTGPSREHLLLPTPSQHPGLITTPPGPALGLPHSLYGCRYTTIYSTDQRLPIVWEGILKGTLSLGI